MAKVELTIHPPFAKIRRFELSPHETLTIVCDQDLTLCCNDPEKVFTPPLPQGHHRAGYTKTCALQNARNGYVATFYALPYDQDCPSPILDDGPHSIVVNS